MRGVVTLIGILCVATSISQIIFDDEDWHTTTANITFTHVVTGSTRLGSNGTTMITLRPLGSTETTTSGRFSTQNVTSSSNTTDSRSTTRDSKQSPPLPPHHNSTSTSTTGPRITDWPTLPTLRTLPTIRPPPDRSSTIQHSTTHNITTFKPTTTEEEDKTTTLKTTKRPTTTSTSTTTTKTTTTTKKPTTTTTTRRTTFVPKTSTRRATLAPTTKEDYETTTEETTEETTTQQMKVLTLPGGLTIFPPLSSTFSTLIPPVTEPGNGTKVKNGGLSPIFVAAAAIGVDGALASALIIILIVKRSIFAPMPPAKIMSETNMEDEP